VARSLFPDPRRVAVWGYSAGAYGIDCNLTQIRGTWPGVKMASLQNAYAPFESIYATMWPAIEQGWGVWHPDPIDVSIVEDTCPIAIPQGSTEAWSLTFMTNYNHLYNSSVRKATTDDYSDGTLDFFACVTGATPDANGSCAAAVSNSLEDALALIGDDPAFRVYYHTGTCHSGREDDGNAASGGLTSCDYDVMTQPPAKKNGAHFNDWVNAWLNDSPSWRNVQ